MPNANGHYSRPEKLDDAKTILYEIEMLRFARGRLHSPTASWSPADEWVYLEDFLLHYRNLIEFFGNQSPRNTDLSIRNPADFWAGAVPALPVLNSMARADLWEKYNTSDNPEAISKYLHHCTKQRTVAKDWDVNALYEELRPTIEKF